MKEKNKPLISVIMSEYNTELNLLENSIKSIIEQTYDNFEFIIIDDCSNNDVTEITKKYNDDRIIVIKNKENSGLIYSLNKAISFAKGKYIFRMDTDDFSYKDRIKVTVDFMEKNQQYDIVGARCDFYDKEIWGESNFTGEITRKHLLTGSPLIHPTVAYKTSSIKKIGGYLNYKRCEDYATWIEAYCKNLKMYVMENKVIKYHLSKDDYQKRTLKTRKDIFRLIDTQYRKLNPSYIDICKIKTKTFISGIIPGWVMFKIHKRKFKNEILLNKNDKVSIIITTYNGVNNVEYAVISALSQNYKNKEIIVVDDNGKNTINQINTENILKKYIESNMIKYIIHDQNINGSAARNTGARSSTGKWLAFLDDDDIYLENKISSQHEYANLKKYNLVICKGYFIKQNGRGYITKFKNRNDLLVDLLTNKTLFNTTSIFILKDFYFKINGFDESFKRHQDWEFFSRAITLGNVGTLNKTLYVKYQFSRNNAKNAEMAEIYINHFFEKVGDILKNYNSNKYNVIYDYQMLRIAQQYIKEKDYQNYRRLINKTSKKNLFFSVCSSFIRHAFRKVFFGFRKRYLSYNNAICLLEKKRGAFFD